MTNTFKIALLSTGSDPDDWTTLETLLSVAGKQVDPDWSYSPSANFMIANSGKKIAKGSPLAAWHWNIFKDWQREALRAFCPSPALSAEVYICTPVNETSSGAKTWGNFSAWLQWPDGDEDHQAGNTLGLTINFTHLVAVTVYGS